jgi:hypothetical protein
MGGQIPRPIKVEVIRKWLEGKSRDQISKEAGIATGTVTSIINQVRQDDTEFDLMRQVAVKLKNQGDTLESFASAIRSREILKRLLLDTPTTTAVGENSTASKVEEKIESLILALEVFCFKQKVSIKDFVDLVHQLYSIADRLGVPLEKLPTYVKELENEVNRVHEEIEDINLKKQRALEKSGATLELLEEFRHNLPLFETNQKLREQLDKMTKERAEKILGEQFDKEIEGIESGISEEELDEANMKLGYSSDAGVTYMVQELKPDNLMEMVMEIYFNPSKHIDIIRQLMKTRQ